MNIKDITDRKSALKVWLTVFVLFNLIVFIIPYPKFTNFWIVYTFTIIAFGFSYYQLIKVFEGVESLSNALFTYPQVKACVMYLIVQIVLFVLFSGTHDVPYWIPFICCSVLLAAFIVYSIVLTKSKQEIDRIDTKNKQQVVALKSAAIDVKGLVDMSDDKLITDKLLELYEALYYSDPMTSAELEVDEAEINLEIKKLKSGDITARQVDNIIALVNKRNEKCKLYK